MVLKLIAYAGEDYDPDDGADVDFVSSCIDMATAEVLNAMYPYGLNTEEKIANGEAKALLMYPQIILQVAEYKFDKRGKEGVISYSENGSETYYENSATPKSFFRNIVPKSQIC